MKYTLNYTVTKNEPPPLYRREYFKTKKDLNKFLKENKTKIYWHQVTLTHPKSKKPKPLIAWNPEEAGYQKTVGTLETYFETGMECLGLVVYKDGVHGGPNPGFDPTKPESRQNFKFFKSFDGLTYIKSGHVIEFEDGTKIGMLKDIQFAKDDGFRLSFYPQGFTKENWLELFRTEQIKVTLWEKPAKKEGT